MQQLSDRGRIVRLASELLDFLSGYQAMSIQRIIDSVQPIHQDLVPDALAKLEAEGEIRRLVSSGTQCVARVRAPRGQAAGAQPPGS